MKSSKSKKKYRTEFQKEILKLKKNKTVNQKIVKAFINRIQKNGKLTKNNNPVDHFGAFFLPFHSKTKSVYLGHHIKAGGWIPPGGHVELNELPWETVKREFSEELNHKLDKELIEFFDITLTNVQNKNEQCRIHYDMWYIVHLKDMEPLPFDTKEFYDARWFSLEEAIQTIYRTTYRQVLKKIRNII